MRETQLRAVLLSEDRALMVFIKLVSRKLSYKRSAGIWIVAGLIVYGLKPFVRLSVR